jgi:hypothetical protein
LSFNAAYFSGTAVDSFFYFYFVLQVRDSRAKTMSDAEDDGFEVVEGWGGDGKRSSQSEKKKPQRAFSETISRGSRCAARATCAHSAASSSRDNQQL